VLAPGQSLASARFNLTVDNAFELWVNGRRTGSGDNFKQVYVFDLAASLRPGTNLIAVVAENTLDFPNPAGFIGVLELRFQDESAREIKTDKQWESATNAAPNWLTDAYAPEGWVAAMEVGPFGMEPWGDLDTSSGPPYVFPDFQAISGVLQKLGVPPDFEADSSLRFIHRRERDTDIYFVANSQTNWLQANCGFRVAGKRPELWDPLTGRISFAAAYEEKDGRTFVPLTFEPAGSVFVIFREPLGSRGGRGIPEAIVAISRQGQELLPKPGQGSKASPSIELTAGRSGEVRGLVWEAGHYEFKTTTGQVRSLELHALPSAIELAGPWQVHFRPGRGAPEEVTFPVLSDWSQHSDPGVRYFSGTATYKKSFTLSVDLPGPQGRAFLDLGEVAVMAQVKLNGKDLGTLWKAPYRVEVTQGLKAVENVLEVQVVNLWINRMIGDEQLPEDSDRNPNGTLKRWPDWLEQGQRSPTGRFTFTSWRLWKKDSPLQRSGLIGPVRIIPAKEEEVVGAR
jgi:hypothetical protein